MRWYPSAMMDAQLSHVGWGAFVILAASLHFGLAIALCGLTGFVLLKEFVFDLVVERDTWILSAFDAAMYYAGGILGWLVWLW